MRKVFFLTLLSWAFPLHARVIDLHSDIRIARSGELTVTERIAIEEPKPAPGLERELPPGSRVVHVIRNGRAEPYALEDDGLRARLRIGAPPFGGRHVYEVSYRSRRVLRFLDSHDELRWSVQGAERLTAEVRLPAAVQARSIKAEIAGRDAQSLLRDGGAAFRSKERMTIVVRFPKEVVVAPQLGERARWFLADYLGLLLVLAGLCLAAAALARLRTLAARG